VKLKSRKLIPALLCVVVAGLVASMDALTRRAESFDFLQRPEWIIYAWRVRVATNQPALTATNLGFVSINDESITELKSGVLGYQAGLYWPRFIYGHLVQELNTQGAEAIAFDVLFLERRPDHKEMPDGSPGTPDEFFAAVMGLAGNVLLAADKGALPDPLFRDSAQAVGDVAAKRENDGILRRTKAFESYLSWHPMIRDAQRTVNGFRFSTNELVFPVARRRPVRIAIDAEGNFDQSALYELAAEAAGSPRRFPTNANRISRAWRRERVWDLGIALAAFHLKLDLAHPQIEPGRRIVLRGPGVERVIPIDAQDRFYIDWNLTPFDPDLTRETLHSLLHQHRARALGNPTNIVNLWSNKLVFVGSTASGNDLTDVGSTPLEKESYLTSRNWNIANSVLTGRFIQPTGNVLNFLVILALGFISGWLTWQFRALTAALCVVLLCCLHLVAALQCYLQARLWLPVVMPCGCLFLTHFALITYRGIFEQKEQRRIRSIFSKIVSPNVVSELLQAEHLSLGGARRQITVFFSDVRGFTEMTDESHARAEQHVRQHQLAGAAADAYFDEQAKEVLATVNRYLGIIADKIKQHEGTLDKYIGDCVMAFWGAPTPNDQHALSCVRAAIDAQRAVYALNLERVAENKRRETENVQRAAQGEPPLTLLKILSMGTGINTGTVTIGLMGSEQHISNYTVFGRDVNLAARLEGHSGRGRIFIGEATYQEILKDDPALAASCTAQAPITFKGFRVAVKTYEVPWKIPQPAAAPGETETTVTRAQRTAGS